MSDTEQQNAVQVASGEAAVEGIKDNEDYIQRRRLKEIYDAKEEVRMQRAKIETMVEDPDYPFLDEEAGRRMLRSEVVDFLMTIEPLITNRYPEVGSSYWNEVELDTIICRPPPHLRSDATPSPFDGYLEILEEPDVQTKVLAGLSSILDTKSPLEFEFEALVNSRSESEPWVESFVVQKVISKKALINAMRLATLFLADIGIEVELDQEEEAVGEYSDILNDD